MGILEKIFGASKSLPFKETVRFERIKSDFKVNIGEKLNIWNKPNTQQVLLYAKGSSGGNGLVGIASNSTISYHLRNTNDLFIETKVVGETNSSIDLFIHLYSDLKATHEIQLNHKTEWIERLNKVYHPKTSWELRFYSETSINRDDFLIQTIDKSQIEEYYQKDDQTIWLTDRKGEKLPVENRIRSGGAEKTLRAIFSGHELHVLSFKKEHPWYYIEVGIKP